MKMTKSVQKYPVGAELKPRFVRSRQKDQMTGRGGVEGCQHILLT